MRKSFTSSPPPPPPPPHQLNTTVALVNNAVQNGFRDPSQRKLGRDFPNQLSMLVGPREGIRITNSKLQDSTSIFPGFRNLDHLT